MKKKAAGEQDVAGMMAKIQEQLTFLERKIDTLIGQSREKPFRPEHNTKPFQRFEHQRPQREQRTDNSFNQRTLHKAICADCSKECEVPFRPSQDRPVYCKDCFSKRKGGSPFKGNAENRPWEKRPDQAAQPEKTFGGKKSFKKKRPAVKRRKARG